MNFYAGTFLVNVKFLAKFDFLTRTAKKSCLDFKVLTTLLSEMLMFSDIRNLHNVCDKVHSLYSEHLAPTPILKSVPSQFSTVFQETANA